MNCGLICWFYYSQNSDDICVYHEFFRSPIVSDMIDCVLLYQNCLKGSPAFVRGG